ncbi:MAG: type IVB secretion system protein IcmH/DotU [Candidatus Eisenbacteria bacterium]|uniref:Type IVB secretion system protein IcmH/DotU n=1 Tax=Eiseniibacteriota bacterium TaxID=2212470 RepID=A0A956NGU9_UNCEI|nr:type IVB secretion system protein IcmH/DotU [Candidatus Eisenbacteria bacterium]MCB9463368.1 DotU family type IV/VI secretion system protein [Candidatus Eisenbacteria bacterium]
MSDAAQTMVPGAAVRGRGALAKAAGPVLSMLFVLRRTNDLDSLRDVQVAVISQIEEFRRTARDLGIGSGDIEDATYAIAATFDETMLTRQWQGRESWQSQSLAQRYCQNEFVGLGFYDKLAQVRRSTPPRPDVTEIFFYCLVAGFQGRLVDSPKEHADLVDELAREIAPPAKELAPKAYAEKGRLAPFRRFPWVAVILSCLTLPFLVWLVSWSVLDGRAAKIVDQFHQIRF